MTQRVAVVLFNLGGPDTYNYNQQDNVEVTASQGILEESDWLPRIDLLAGFNSSNFNTQTRDANGGIQQVSVGNPGYNLSQTITIASVTNGLGTGVIPSNGNLQYGTFDHEVVRYQWNRNDNDTTRQQERVELTASKNLFAGKWYQLEDQLLLGYSEIGAFNHAFKRWTGTSPGRARYARTPNFG